MNGVHESDWERGRPREGGKERERGAIVVRLTTPHDRIVLVKLWGRERKKGRDAKCHILGGAVGESQYTSSQLIAISEAQQGAMQAGLLHNSRNEGVSFP